MTCVVAFCCKWCMSSCVPGCDMCLPNVVPSWVPHVRDTSEVGRSFTPVTLVAARIAVAVSCGSACDSVSLRERSYFGHRSASVVRACMEITGTCTVALVRARLEITTCM